MTSRSNEAQLARKQRLREKQRRQMQILASVEKVEKKLAEANDAKAKRIKAVEEEATKKVAAIEQDAAKEVAAAELEMAKAVRCAVQDFGGQQNASDELGMSLRDIRRYLSLADGGAEYGIGGPPRSAQGSATESVTNMGPSRASADGATGVVGLDEEGVAA